ncbi:MAG: hypothetical protein ACOZCF_07970, partial [Bacillota bacterium]
KQLTDILATPSLASSNHDQCFVIAFEYITALYYPPKLPLWGTLFERTPRRPFVRIDITSFPLFPWMAAPMLKFFYLAKPRTAWCLPGAKTSPAIIKLS